MPNRRSLLSLTLSCTAALPCYCQTPLAQSFADMKSKDPQVADEARKHVALVFEQEAPIIEQDTQLLCSSLHDADAYIRRQAAALLTAILLAAPQHSKVDVACFPDLVAASGDPDDTTRNDILFVLAMTPAGPPGSARDVFVTNLDSPNDRTSEVAAAGLLRAGGERKQENEMLVKAKLDKAPDARQRLNMLYAIGGSGVQSEALLGSSRKFLSDADPDVQRAAFQAIAATGTKAEVARIMGAVAASPSSSPEAKKRAQLILAGQQAPPPNQAH
jgi:HEAT repeat protein